MSEVKDPKIKLFGKTIELPETFTRDPCSVSEDSNLNVDEEEQESNKSLSVPKETDSKVENQCKPSTSEDLKDSSGGVTVKASKNKEDQNESSNSQDQKALLKPDKIIPCPRCNSMETKFCYFNNYNVNQPRHFCKNCQRYWTAGGTMRNVPVGAGRRKSKHLASQYRHITGPESLSGGRVDLPNGLHNPPVNQNGAVLTFGSNTPLCESMASGLSIGDKTTRCNRFQELEVSRSKENVESGSSLDARPDMMPNCHSFPLTMPCFPRAPWGYPFYPTIGPSTFPVPIYPTAPPYWNFAVPGTWNVPLNFPPMPTAPGSGPISPTLGKHSREESTLKLDIGKEEVEKESDSEKCLWVPKTLRIDDPGEAAKSSIWATLGIKKDTGESIGVVSGSLCKAFESKSKGDEKTRLNETSTVLQANPAALSRSLSFHESS